MIEDASHHRLKRPLAGFAILMTLLLPFGLVGAPASQTLAVIGLPGQNAGEIVARAGGSILRLGGWNNILVVQAESSDFVARLYAAGAWLVVDARFAGGCDPVRSPPAPRT